MDKGMKKVINLVTKYMSALCETGARPGYFDRFPAARTFARVLNEYFL